MANDNYSETGMWKVEVQHSISKEEVEFRLGAKNMEEAKSSTYNKLDRFGWEPELWEVINIKPSR